MLGNLLETSLLVHLLLLMKDLLPVSPLPGGMHVLWLQSRDWTAPAISSIRQYFVSIDVWRVTSHVIQYNFEK
jgi:hypothetical protein